MSEHLCIAFVPLFNHLSQEAQQKIMALANHHTYPKSHLIVTHYYLPENIQHHKS